METALLVTPHHSFEPKRYLQELPVDTFVSIAEFLKGRDVLLLMQTCWPFRCALSRCNDLWLRKMKENPIGYFMLPAEAVLRRTLSLNPKQPLPSETHYALYSAGCQFFPSRMGDYVQIKTIGIHPTGMPIVTTTMDGGARVWKEVGDAWTCTSQFAGHPAYRSTAINAEGTRVLTSVYPDCAPQDPPFTLYEWQEIQDSEWRISNRLLGCSSLIQNMAFDPNDNFFVTGEESGDVCIWEKDVITYTYHCQAGEKFSSIQIDPAGTSVRVGIGPFAGSLLLIKEEKGWKPRTFLSEDCFYFKSFLVSLDFSTVRVNENVLTRAQKIDKDPTGTYLLTASPWEVTFWKEHKGSWERLIQYNEMGATDFVIHPQRAFIATVLDKTMTIRKLVPSRLFADRLITCQLRNEGKNRQLVNLPDFLFKRALQFLSSKESRALVHVNHALNEFVTGKPLKTSHKRKTYS